MNNLSTMLGCAVALLVSFSVLADIVLPKVPKTDLPAFDSPFWETTENWPNTLTNQGVIYELSVTCFDRKEKSPFESFSEAKEKGFVVRNAWYKCGIEGFSKLPEPNSGNIGYGPDFTWREDGTLRIKAFRFENGFWIHVSLDRNGKAWWKGLSDPVANQNTWVLYDKDETIIGFLQGPDDYDRPYDNERTIILNDEVATESEFFSLLRKLAEERGS